MTSMVTRSKEKHRDRSDISRVDFAEPLVMLHTLLSWVQGEALVGPVPGGNPHSRPGVRVRGGNVSGSGARTRREGERE